MAESYQPGIYKGTSFSAYAAIEAVNQSLLGHMGRSPLHARHYQLHMSEQSESMALGTALHAAVLEPKLFAKSYAVAPPCDRRTKAGKDAWAAFESANKDKIVLTSSDHESITSMQSAVLADFVARLYLSGKGANEVVLVWQDEETGLLCKARADRIVQLDGWTWVPDVKTTRDASRREFARSIAKYGYHRQAAYYLEGMNTLRGPIHRRWLFIAVENEPPYATALYELDQESIDQGSAENRQNLRRYADCVKWGVWPGYPVGVTGISLPSWARRTDEWINEQADD